jgi:DNA-binding GntR family transcriptional regulator
MKPKKNLTSRSTNNKNYRAVGSATRKIKKDALIIKHKDINAWEIVYEFLKDKIIDGTYAPGEKLNEREIAKLVNVSRTPTREALKKLEFEGYVTNYVNRGVFVKKYSPEELDVLQKMLILLEGLAIDMAAPKLSKRDFANLENMADQGQSLSSEMNYRAYMELNLEFHLYFSKITGSRELLDTISQLRRKLYRFYYSHIIMAHGPFKYVNDHKEIIEALRGKINKNPRKIMERHIERSRKIFMNFYSKFYMSSE